MIQAHELRIGNLVFSKETNEVQKIIGITLENPFIDGVTLDDVNYNEISALPITEGWLLKFGFKKEFDEFYRLKKSSMIEVFFYDNGISVTNQSVCLNNIKHVHQLQNLYFALTQTELTVC